jgi:hypothetical protein
VKSNIKRSNTAVAPKRLMVAAETIRVLADAELRSAAGGKMDPSYRDDIGGC